MLFCPATSGCGCEGSCRCRGGEEGKLVILTFYSYPRFLVLSAVFGESDFLVLSVLFGISNFLVLSALFGVSNFLYPL